MAECGTHAQYSIGGCRCFPCRKAHHEYNQYREKQIAYGRWDKFVPAGPVRQHVRSLMASGIGHRRIADMAEVGTGTVIRLLYGDRRGSAPSRRVRTESAARILALQPSLDAVGCTTAVDGTGTRRRLQALVAVGWSQAKIGKRLGIMPTNIGRMLTSERVTAGSARSVRDLYDQMWDAVVPEEEWRDKIAANRARGYAAERGWAPPMAWDDETIDDPAAVPVGAGVSKRVGKLPSAEEIAWLVQGGDSIEVIADRYGAKPNAVHQKLLRAKEAA